MNKQVLGVRTGAKFIQYAVLEFSATGYTFINKNEEHKLTIPARLTNLEDKIKWVYDEFECIYTKYQRIYSVSLKTNEYGRDTKAIRMSNYFDATIILSAKKNNKVVFQYIYNNFKNGINSGTVKQYAEANIGRSDKYWDNKMADALVAAWFGRPDENSL